MISSAIALDALVKKDFSILGIIPKYFYCIVKNYQQRAVENLSSIGNLTNITTTVYYPHFCYLSKTKEFIVDVFGVSLLTAAGLLVDKIKFLYKK